MLPFLIIGAALIGGYLLTHQATTSRGGPAPGTITIGPGPSAPSAQWTGGGPNPFSEASLGVSSFAAVGAGSAGGIFGTGAAAAGTAFGSAVPIVGSVVAVVGGIVAAISAHHKAALAAEGRTLNDATPRAEQTFALIIQGAAQGEIKDIATAQQYVNTTITLWYGEVKPIQRGTWHYTGQDLSADYNKVWIQRTQVPAGAPGYSDYHAPDSCNAACVMGHFFIERNGFLVMAYVKDILAGNHGTAVLPTIPPHETQQGYPQISITY